MTTTVMMMRTTTMIQSQQQGQQFAGSYNLQKDWKKCCAVAMGFEWVDDFNFDSEMDHRGVHASSNEAEKTKTNIDMMIGSGIGGPELQITNLLDGSEFDNPIVISNKNDGSLARLSNQKNKNQQKGGFDEEGTTKGEGEDHWNENASRIQADLSRMSKWIRSKSQQYISLEMKDDEASLIQSTVTSYAATTASELDTLRKIIPAETASSSSSSSSNDVANHRSGIIQILLSQLQEQITKPFGILQKQRTRVAVSIWQNPIQCKLYQPKMIKSNEYDNEGGRGNETTRIEEQRFIPQKQSNDIIPSSFYDDFISQYNEEEEDQIPVRPAFLSRFEPSNNSTDQQRRHHIEQIDDDDDDDVNKEKRDYQSSVDADRLKAIQQQQPQQIPNYYDQQQQQNNNQYSEENDILQEEARLLTQAIRHNDLDSVHKMEQRMVEITTLISQFANLVSEQQEDIIQIHEASKDAKTNINKGKEDLVDATERTKQSKHYMAYSILMMSIILIFFDLLRN